MLVNDGWENGVLVRRDHCVLVKGLGTCLDME